MGKGVCVNVSAERDLISVASSYSRGTQARV